MTTGEEERIENYFSIDGQVFYTFDLKILMSKPKTLSDSKDAVEEVRAHRCPKPQASAVQAYRFFGNMIF